MTEIDTDYAVAPAEFIREWLDDAAISQAELARRMGVSPKHVSMLLAGATLTPETALQLELVTGVPSRLWLSYEATYRADLVRIAAVDEYAKERELAEQFPLSELRARGIVTATIKKPGLVILELLRFFGVGSVDSLRQCIGSPVAAFRQGKAKADPGAVATWLRLAELEAQSSAEIETPFDEHALRMLLPELKALSRQPPQHFGRLLAERLNSVGVGLLYMREVKGARAYGATRWVDGRPYITLSLRGADDGQFWFTLFHEIAHVLLHSRNAVFVHLEKDGRNEKAELAANRWAGDQLIPPAYGPHLHTLKWDSDVLLLAEMLNVSPGVVVGRLHHEKIWEYSRGRKLLKSLRIVD